MYEPISAPVLTPGEFRKRVTRHLGLIAGVMGGSLLLGMAGYMGLARMNWVDAFLNAAMLLGGMGPVGDLPTNAAKVFAGLYALYAGIVFIASAGIMIAPFAHRLLHKLHADDDD